MGHRAIVKWDCERGGLTEISETAYWSTILASEADASGTVNTLGADDGGD